MILRFAIYNLLFAILILIVPGCSYVSVPSLPWSSSSQLKSDPTAEALIEEGMGYFNNKRYALAIDRLQRVKAEFPFSSQLVTAELKLAEAYYLNKQYPEAAAAFKEFHSLHPTNENIPYVNYQLGMVHFEQFSSADRDQKMTEIAKGYFETVVKNYPNSPHASKAREKLAQCLEYLAEHQFTVAGFYLREKKFAAARDRFEEILERYRDTQAAPKSLYHLGESYRLEKNTVKAALAYQALVQNYPQSPLVKEARNHLALLEKEKYDPLAILLARDRRPAPALPRTFEGAQLSAANPQQRELNLVAKREVVHEEPGSERGIFRRVVDTLNPFASSSETKGASAEKKGESTKAVETAKLATDKDQGEKATGFWGSLWKGLNPFSQRDLKTKTEAANPNIVGQVDLALKEKGIHSASQRAPKPPAQDFSGLEAPTPPPADTAKLLGNIDASLKAKGKEAQGLPPTPEIHPAFKAASTKAPAEKAAPTQPSSTKALVTDIDAVLKRKGVEPKPTEIGSSVTSTLSSAATRQEKIELDTRLPQEKRPLFLEAGDVQPQARAPESEQLEKPQGKPTESPRELPQAVVKGPPQPQPDRQPDLKPDDKKKSEEEETPGAFEQFKDSVKRLGTILNPFSW